MSQKRAGRASRARCAHTARGQALSHRLLAQSPPFRRGDQRVVMHQQTVITTHVSLLCVRHCAQRHVCFVSFEPHTTNVTSILKRRKQVQRGDGTSPTSHSLEVAEPGCELRQFGYLTSLGHLCLRAIPKLFGLLVPKDVCIPHLSPSHSGPPQPLHPSLSLVSLPSFLFSFSFQSISLFLCVSQRLHLPFCHCLLCFFPMFCLYLPVFIWKI